MKTTPQPVIEIITVGREILDGRVLDSNSSYLGSELTLRGVVPRYAQRVDDDLERIGGAFKTAAERSHFVLVTGGLGPTSDDLTAEAFAKFSKVPLEKNKRALDLMEAFFKKIGRPLTEVQLKQVMLPQGATPLTNEMGTAPGFVCTFGDSRFFFMPGVPKEMKVMFRNEVSPQLPTRADVKHYSWATQFTSEGDLQTRLNDITMTLPPDFELTFRTRFPENHIGLIGVCPDSASLTIFENLKSRISDILSTDVFSEGAALNSLEFELLSLLSKKGVGLGTVESCTSGLVSSRICDVSGASENFIWGEVTYSNLAKVNRGVSETLINTRGAVSLEVAEEMARCGLQFLKGLGLPFKHLMCLSTTGIAGPLGGTEKKPVGLCYLGVAWTQNGQDYFNGAKVLARAGLERSEYKLYFSQKVLEMARLICTELL